MLKRVASDPGNPASDPNPAPWQQPSHRLAHAKSPSLPETADMVILGSGITGCAVARTLLSTTEHLSKKPRVVILDARTLCSGASGRNGGHLRDTPFMYLSYFKSSFGSEMAKKMASFRARQVKEVIELAKEENVFAAAEFRQVEAVDIALEEEKWLELQQGADAYIECVAPGERVDFETWDASRARKVGL